MGRVPIGARPNCFLGLELGLEDSHCPLTYNLDKWGKSGVIFVSEYAPLLINQREAHYNG
jgi:hypothetical protein